MTEALIGLLIGGTIAALAVGYTAHRREEQRILQTRKLWQMPPTPPRVQVWRDDRLVYDGPERRSSERLPIDSDQSYRWPCLVEEATTEPDEDDAPVVDTVRVAMGGMSIDEVEAARRIAAKYDPWQGDIQPPAEDDVEHARRWVGRGQEVKDEQSKG